MHFGEFSPDDIVPYLEQELPGFKPELIRESGSQRLILKVRGALHFNAYADISQEILFPLNQRGAKVALDEFIRRTRGDAIHKLGLQKEIDDAVKRQVAAQLDRIRHEEFKKAYEQAMREVSASAVQNVSIQGLLDLIHSVPASKDDDE